MEFGERSQYSGDGDLWWRSEGTTEAGFVTMLNKAAFILNVLKQQYSKILWQLNTTLSYFCLFYNYIFIQKCWLCVQETFSNIINVFTVIFYQFLCNLIK